MGGVGGVAVFSSMTARERLEIENLTFTNSHTNLQKIHFKKVVLYNFAIGSFRGIKVRFLKIIDKL